MPPPNPLNSENLSGEREALMSTAFKLFSHDESNSKTEETFLSRLHERILMVVQKATSPTISVSTATIGLLIVMVVQFASGIWWGASISKDSSRNTEELKALQSENSTLKVYLDNLREKQIKMEAVQENLVREQQVLNLMIQQQKGNR